MSSSDTFYWHDYEPSGADVAEDRPWQFAGIRTNADLEIIGEPLTLYARPAPDRLPHPAAVRVTGITPQEAESKGYPEVEFIRRIHAELRSPTPAALVTTRFGLTMRLPALPCGVISSMSMRGSGRTATLVGICLM